MRDLHERSGFPHLSGVRRLDQVCPHRSHPQRLCVIFGDALVLLWVIRGMIRQDARDHADGCVTDRSESSLSRPFPRRLLLASLIGGCEMRLMRDQPQGRVREPVAKLMVVCVPMQARCVAVRTSTPTRSRSGWWTYALHLLGFRPYSCSRMGHPFLWDSYPGNSSLRGVSHEIKTSY